MSIKLNHRPLYQFKLYQSKHHMLASSLCVGLAIAIMPTAQAVDTDIEIEFVAPKQNSQVAFVPFANDGVISPIVIKELNSSELNVTSQNLPQMPHSSADLSATLSQWQQLGIPYLVVGSTHSQAGKLVIEYEVIDVMSGRVLEGKQRTQVSNNTSSRNLAGLVIADKIYSLITGKETDFTGRIAYIEEQGSGENKLSKLKIMDATGENARTLTQVKGSIFSPTWSPDGRTLAYAVQRPKGLPVIYVQNADGGGARLVTPYKGNNLSPSFSPDGSQLLFSSSFQGNADIYLLQLGTGSVQRLVSLPSNEIQPSFAPDGRSFVFVSDQLGANRPQIYRHTFGSGQISRVSKVGSYATTPSISPDGNHIAFLNGRSVAIMNSGSGAMIANLGNTGIDEAASFSPSGNRVVFASKQGNHGVINIRSLTGGQSFSKSANGVIRSPVWSKAAK